MKLKPEKFVFCTNKGFDPGGRTIVYVTSQEYWEKNQIIKDEYTPKSISNILEDNDFFEEDLDGVFYGSKSAGEIIGILLKNENFVLDLGFGKFCNNYLQSVLEESKKSY